MNWIRENTTTLVLSLGAVTAELLQAAPGVWTCGYAGRSREIVAPSEEAAATIALAWIINEIEAVVDAARAQHRREENAA